MELTAAGALVEAEWLALPQRFPAVGLDAFVVMPNHMHGVLFLHPSAVQEARPQVPCLANIVRAFKSLSARAVNRSLDRADRPMWQRNYYEHILRDDADLARIQQYIADNPIRWADDPEHSAQTRTQP